MNASNSALITSACGCCVPCHFSYGVNSSFSFVSTTNTASSLAGSVLFADRSPSAIPEGYLSFFGEYSPGCARTHAGGWVGKDSNDLKSAVQDQLSKIVVLIQRQARSDQDNPKAARNDHLLTVCTAS